MPFSESSDFPEDEPHPDQNVNGSKDRESRNKPNKFLVFSGMTVQMGATIGIGVWCGQLLDEEYKLEKPYWTIALALLGVFVSLYLMIKQAKKLSDDT